MVNFWDSKVERVFNAFPNMFITLTVLGMIYMFIHKQLLPLTFSFVYNCTILYFLISCLITNVWFIHRSNLVVSAYTSFEIFIYRLLNSLLGLISNFLCRKLNDIVSLNYFETYTLVGVGGYVISVCCILLYVSYLYTDWRYL